MYYVKTFFFLAFCFLLGVGLMYGIRYFRRNNADDSATSHIGIGNAPPLRGFALFLDKSTPATIANLPVTQLYATAISLSYPATGGERADTVLAESVSVAHKMGIQVLLLPPRVFTDGNPYPQPLTQIAQEAQNAHVDALCLTWLDREPDSNLLREIAAVRKIFTGKLIFATTPDVLIAADSFDDIDYIAAIGPVTLPQRLPNASEDVDLHTMCVFWECVLGSLESHALKSSRGLLLLNMTVPETTPLSLQPLTYEALLTQTKGRLNVEGLFLPWSPPGSDIDSTAINRFPEVMRKIPDLWSDKATR